MNACEIKIHAKMLNMLKRLPLNALEKFMLAHESEHLSYNSQICVEFDGEFDLQVLKSAIDSAIKNIPLLRSKIKITPLAFKRYYQTPASFTVEDVLKIYEYTLDQNTLDEFCNKKFNLKNGPAFRFLISKTRSGKNILVFNVHHSLCDAAGQFHLLEEIFRIIEGMPIRAGALSDKVFRYRDLWKYMGRKWMLHHFFDNFKPLNKQRQYKMASLIDHPERTERYVTSHTISLTLEEQKFIRDVCRKYEISITEYLTYCCFRAMDSSLQRRGDSKTPIMVYLPKTLRPLLKIRYSFQNILSTVLIVGKRDEIFTEKFLGKVKHSITSHKMDKAAKFIFGSLWYCSFMRPKALQKYFKDLDSSSAAITSSMLLSAGLVPLSFTFPSRWTNISVWARGTMLKSPGIGVIFTGVRGAETITFEYLQHLTEEQTILSYKADLLSELLDKNKL
jgi:NRPS condensation-like uncharacterized protein